MKKQKNVKLPLKFFRMASCPMFITDVRPCVRCVCRGAGRGWGGGRVRRVPRVSRAAGHESAADARQLRAVRRARGTARHAHARVQQLSVSLGPQEVHTVSAARTHACTHARTHASQSYGQC